MTAKRRVVGPERARAREKHGREIISSQVVGSRANAPGRTLKKNNSLTLGRELGADIRGESLEDNAVDVCSDYVIFLESDERELKRTMTAEIICDSSALTNFTISSSFM